MYVDLFESTKDRDDLNVYKEKGRKLKMRIGKLVLRRNIPRVVLSLGSVPKEIGPCDIIEIRWDLLTNISDIYIIIKRFLEVPKILTFRSKKDGGICNISEPLRLSFFEEMMPHFDAVDIELSSEEILQSVVENARVNKKCVIVSHHDLNGTPSISEMEKILKRAKEAGADLVKIATTANGNGDVQRLAQFTIANASQNIVTIGMGELGKISRISFPVFGSLLTYTCLEKGATAPGQIGCYEMEKLIKEFYPK